MFSITAIEEEIHNGLQKEAFLNRLERTLSSKYISEENIKIVEEKIEIAKMELKSLQSFTIGDLDQTLIKFDLDYEGLQNKTPKFIISNLIVENELTLFAAGPGVGKSLLTLLFAHNALLTGSVKKVIFFDMDNGLPTLQERNLGYLKNKFQEKLAYIHASVVPMEKMLLLMDRLTNWDLTGIMIVIDAGKNFIIGDRDKNMDVSNIMKFYKSLRNAGASVVILHHTNKSTPEREAEYAGSSAWKEDVTNAFYLDRNDHRKTFICTPFKQRSKNISKIAYLYNASEFDLQTVDLDWALETKEDEFIIISLKDFIANHVEKPTWSMLMSFSKEQGLNKEKANRIIQSGKNKHWKCTKIPEKNFRDVYELLNSEIAKDKSDKSDKSKTIPKDTNEEHLYA